MFGMIGGKAKRPESVQFPFVKREDSLVSAMQRRETQLAGENVVAEIKALKPYPGGNEWLSGMHTLDITDKHKLIIPIASTAHMSTIEFSQMLSLSVGDGNAEIALHQGAKFVHNFTGTRAQRRANRRYIRVGKYERDVQPTFQIVFDEAQPFAANPIVPTLVEMVSKIRDAVARISDAYLR
jgi:hypothetical protein